ncbi:MAG: glycosyltransferase family 2 protein [Patescibacteria group bacterium]
MPKVSIITPTYNGEKFIERAIKSVLWQTFKDWDMIIVDDGSKDRTVEIVKKYAEKDPRIKLIELKENTGGPAIPRTIACQKSQGEYIAFLDQDDIFYPENLEKRVNYLDEHLEIDILSTMAWTFNEETKKIINYEHGGPVNLIVRRKVVEEAGYFKREQNGVDEIGMFYRYFLKNENNLKRTALMSREPISLYSRHPEQGSYVENKDPLKFVKRIEALLNEFTENLKKDIKLNSHFKWFLAWQYSRLGNFYCLANNLKKGREMFIRSLKFRFNIFALLFFLFSFLGYKNYRKIEFFLRMVHRNLLWKAKVLFYRKKFKESYQKALKILKEL